MNQDLVTELINALTILPGVGKKSAQRMALYLLDRNKDGASILANTLNLAVENIQRCSSCRMLTSNDLCKVCLDSSRDAKSICVVESPSDVLAIESTGGFRGKYFVLLGRLSPIDGIGPEDLGIDDLLKIIIKNEIKEVILATSSTVEGDAYSNIY
jgi:recombination protein RecR